MYFKLKKSEIPPPSYLGVKFRVHHHAFIYTMISYDAEKKEYERSTEDTEKPSGFRYTERYVHNNFVRGQWIRCTD